MDTQKMQDKKMQEVMNQLHENDRKALQKDTFGKKYLRAENEMQTEPLGWQLDIPDIEAFSYLRSADIMLKNYFGKQQSPDNIIAFAGILSQIRPQPYLQVD